MFRPNIELRWRVPTTQRKPSQARRRLEPVSAPCLVLLRQSQRQGRCYRIAYNWLAAPLETVLTMMGKKQEIRESSQAEMMQAKHPKEHRKTEVPSGDRQA